MRVGIKKGDTFIGAMSVPEKKRPALVIQKGNTIKYIGCFSNDSAVEEFAEAIEKILKEDA
jgi:hypothetical protein